MMQAVTAGKAKTHTELMREFLSTVKEQQAMLDGMQQAMRCHKEKSLNEKWMLLNERAANYAFYMAECKEQERTKSRHCKNSRQELDACFKQKSVELNISSDANDLMVDCEIQQMLSAYVALGAWLHKWSQLHNELKKFEPS